METVEPTDMTNQIEEIETIDEVTGRQVDADCTGYSFEDMFYYNYGEFIIEINPTWDGAFLRAKAMVNGTDAANMRDDLDGLFEGLAGGDNGWLSTDERDGVEAIGKDCVVQTYTRIGLRGGPSHRGGSGVNWNNATWIKDGMTLEETNLIPEGHPERRDCKDQFGAPSGSPTCEEIPTYPANVGQCGPNSCDTIIYLNASVAFNTITDPSNFTIGMVGRNLTNTQFTYIFPNQASPLRVANSYEDQDCTAAYTEDDDEADDYGVTYTTREECQTYTNEGDLDYTMTAVNDGTSFSRRFTYDGADWPATREYFIDFTTAPPEVDNPPEWSSDAPDEGELIPVAGLGDAEYIVELADVTSWFIDDLGAGMLDVDCTGAAGWNLQETASNHWMVTSPSGGTSATVECLATDSSGQSTSSRTFTVAPIFTIAVAELTVLDGFTFTITPSSNAPSSMNVVLTLMQNGLEVQSSTTVGSATDMTLSVASLSPGSVNLLVQADGDDMNHFEFMYELGITKQSLPPTIEITGFEWVDANYILRGLFSDPDGETVSFTLKIDGVQQGQVSVTGNQWQTDEIPFDLLLEGLHTIGVDACDASGECTSISEDVELVIEDPTDNLPDIISSSDDDSGLPAAGIGLTMMALIGAGFVASRRREE
ncbi:MAG: hypothetical protein HOE69_01825 [Euryarchaeota archaeon]|nr:hypothetical protein [Euryarchaeota archaeon]